ncbi:signal peptidase I [Gallaecimonas xiamenensis]|uniref:Signal peptidase I n=1 Tax=Gallaecimonas xiamenensis 3-C-1 TaxID=745411 RepID=K2JBD4_9GAMM|nr:signal peptidase I [Gallaecimonas xiamenensis]EKE67914.1 signal peptidase I [Gallaecimonas xiamenensis 3-C-1]
MAQLFSIFLVCITLGTGLVWAFDHWLLAPRRRRQLALAEATGNLDQDRRDRLLAEPGLVESCRGAFPVIAAVLVLRSFLYEPFQIPSGSMMPTLLVGDFILVEKFAYGIKDPVWSKKLVATGEPQRGQVFVFKHPLEEGKVLIKRVVGLPGDHILYRHGQLYVQPACQGGQQPCPAMAEVAKVPKAQGAFFQGNLALDTSTEQLGKVKHDILSNPMVPDRTGQYFRQSGHRPGEWTVPPGHYFAMGDNRDNSSDSRFWGFVPEQNLLGRAVFIWISFDMDRSADSWLPTWVPTGVRFGRLGPIK